MLQKALLLGLCFASLSACQSSAESADNSDQEQIDMTTLWVGTYTRKEGHVDGKAAGIYRLSMNNTSGELQQTYVQTDIHNPSFVALSPDRQFLYAVSETGGDVDSLTAYVYAYAVEGDSLRFLNRQPSYSFAPCHLNVHPDGGYLMVANYVGGMIVSYPIQTNGELGDTPDTLRLQGAGPNPRQESSHPHSISYSPDGKWVYVADLGTDKINIFRFNDQGRWWLADPPSVALSPGAGPRHLAFHPSLSIAYSINELNSTVSVFHWIAESGAFSEIEHISTLPEDFSGDNLTADIQLSPDGKYLYASNRGHNSLARFAVNGETGQLSFLGTTPTQGDFPRNFNISPDGEWLYVANQNTDNIVGFVIDPQTGDLTPSLNFPLPTPVCLVFE